MSNPTLSITVTNDNGVQLKFRATMDELQRWNPCLNRSDILNQLADEGEARLQWWSGPIAKLVLCAQLLAEVQ